MGGRGADRDEQIDLDPDRPALDLLVGVDAQIAVDLDALYPQAVAVRKGMTHASRPDPSLGVEPLNG
jgi:hypothetical protein